MPSLVVAVATESMGRRLETAGIGPVVYGRLWTFGNKQEAGMFVDCGFSDGAVLTTTSDGGPSLTLTVGVSSPLLRALTWFVLGMSVAVGVAAVGVAAPPSWDPPLRLILGLGLGALAAWVSLFALQRAWMARSPTVMVARLDRELSEWVSTLR